MAKRENEHHTLKDALKTFITTHKLEKGLDKVAVEEAWKNLMGNGVNNYTHSVLLKGSTLYVSLTSSVLREELNYGKEKIKTMLNNALGKEIVSKIIFR